MASQGVISKYKTKSGNVRWEIRFWCKDWTGKNRQVHKSGFITRAEAKAWYDGYVNEGAGKPDLTFGQLYDAYMEDIRTRLKVTTFTHKEWTFNRHILPYFKDARVSDITPRSIVQWQNRMMKEEDPRTGEGFSPTYLYSIHEQMSAILNYAVKYYGLKGNPCKVTGAMGESRAEEMNIWTLEQFQVFLQNEEKTLYRIIFEILFFSGIREGEMLALTPEDIPEDQDIIRIRKSYAVINGKQIVQSPKTKKSVRDVSIPKAVHDDIRKYIRDVYIGPKERICLYSKTALNRELKRVAEKAGLPVLHVHELRHSHVSYLIGKGIDIATISRRLGHENISTTLNIYGHFYPGNEKDVTSALDAAKDRIDMEGKPEDAPGEHSDVPENGPED